MHWKRINGFGAVNPLVGSVFKMNNTEAKSKSLIKFREKLLETHPLRMLWIYFDNSETVHQK